MTYHGEETSSRFAVLETPVALPAKCAVCGTPQGPLVDFGLDIDMYGVVYFCLVCLEAAAAKANLFAKYSEKLNKIRIDLAAFEDLKRRINEVRNDGNATVSAIGAFLDLLLDFSGSGFIPDESDTEKSGAPEYGTPEASGSDAEADRQDDSVIVDEGSPELSSSANNGPVFPFGLTASNSE